jgi:hypothetical protein
VAELGLHLAYIDAHRLLPPGYPSSAADIRAHAPLAVWTLDDPLSPSESVLSAIMVLGHTPDEFALSALRRHASHNGTHADMASLAADECAWLTETAEPPPNQPPQPNPMLN